MYSGITVVPSKIIHFVFGSFIVTLFSGGMIIPVFVLCCMYIIWKARFQIDNKLLYSPQLLTLFALLLWVSVSYFWAIAPEDSLETMIKFWMISLFGIFAITCLMYVRTDKIKPINSNLLLSFLVMISIILILEHISGYSLALFLRRLFNFEIYNYGQPMDHATALYSLLLPFCLYNFRNRKSYFYTLIILSAIVYLLHPMFAASLAVVLAMFAALFINKTGSRGFIILGVLSILMITFLPQIMSVILNFDYFQSSQSMPSSWQERINIWNKTIELISERPVMGWGLDASSKIEAMRPGDVPGIIQLHPHNIPMQFHLETGLIGASLFSIFIFFVWRKFQQQDNRAYGIACAASIAIYFSFAMFSFNAWHSWWLCTQYLAVIVILSFYKISVHADRTSAK